MATYVLIHGAGDVAWSWHLLSAELRERGHDVVAVDLPCDDGTAGLVAYTDTVAEAIGERCEVIVVAHSFGGFTGPLVCARPPVELLVLLSAMVPAPGETPGDRWANTGYEEGDNSDPVAMFLHDVPPELAAEAVARGRDQSDAPMGEPWPLDAWPDVPTRYVLCRDDRFFTPGFVRRMVRDRLGITPDEIGGSHGVALSRPRELADKLEELRAG